MSESPETWIRPTPVTALTGEESFKGTDATVRDYWVWSTSDLRDNVTRGVLAEFLVAKAVGASDKLRTSWDNFDVLTPEGVRVEVKASAYLQSWAQRKLSTLTFRGLSALSWDDETGYGDQPEVRADVFVFAVQTCQDPAAYDALDVSQWEFYVVPAKIIAEYGAKSVGIGFVRQHTAGGAVAWDELHGAIRQAAAARDDHRGDAELA